MKRGQDLNNGDQHGYSEDKSHNTSAIQTHIIADTQIVMYSKIDTFKRRIVKVKSLLAIRRLTDILSMLSRTRSPAMHGRWRVIRPDITTVSRRIIIDTGELVLGLDLHLPYRRNSKLHLKGRLGASLVLGRVHKVISVTEGTFWYIFPCYNSNWKVKSIHARQLKMISFSYWCKNFRIFSLLLLGS